MARTKEMRALLDEFGAHWTEVAEKEVVAHFGDPHAEYQGVIEKGLGLIERGERETLVLSGDDTVPWLQGMITSDLHKLIEEGSGQRTSFVNTTGRFVGEARILHLPEMLLLDLEPGTLEAGLLSHLRRHIIMEKITIADQSEKTARLGLIGPRAAELLERLTTWSTKPSQLKPFAGAWGEFDDQDLIVQRVVWSELPCFDLICDVQAAPRLFNGLRELEEELPLFGFETFETLRIEAGIPRHGAELHDKVIPLEAAFDDAIAYDKGCYLGQEIITRLDTRGVPAKLLRRVILDGDEIPEKGAPLYGEDGEGKTIGHVESARYSPRYQTPVALAFIRRNFNDIGATVTIDGQKGRLEPLLDLREIG